MVFTSCDIYKPSSSSPAAPCPQELAPNFTFVYATRVECSRARKGTRPANTPAGGLDVPFECPHVPTSVRKSSQSVRKWRELKTILRRQLCSSEEVRRLPPCPSRREPKGTGTRTPLPTWSSHLRGVRELTAVRIRYSTRTYQSNQDPQHDFRRTNTWRTILPHGFRYGVPQIEAIKPYPPGRTLRTPPLSQHDSLALWFFGYRLAVVRRIEGSSD